MTEEEKPKLDLDTLAEQAREVLLRDGYHAAMLIVEGSLKNLILQVSELGETHEDKLAQMFVAGLTLARMGDIGVLQQVFLITEAWLSLVEKNKSFIQPSKDPKRKEILMITQMNVPENTMATRSYEMKRNKKGKLVQALKRPQLEGETAESPLLEAFVMGFLGKTGKTDD